MIKIVSGISERGGSTVAHINLCNLFNNNGFDCTFYGPNDWHMGRCKSDKLEKFVVNANDIIISHFIPFRKFMCKKHILSLHERQLFPLSKIDISVYDKIHFLNQEQYDWHNVKTRHFFCPNAHEELEQRPKTVSNIAGIIGSVDVNKQVHVSIERALADGMEQVMIFGTVNDQTYFYDKIVPLLSNKVKMAGFIDNKQSMYDMVSDVYMSSLSENAPFVQDECILTGTKFHGNDNIKYIDKVMSNQDVFKIWVKEVLR